MPATLNIDLNQTAKKNPAMYSLERLHAELGGKIKDNSQEAKRLAQCMKHVATVLKMLQPGYGVRSIAVRRRKPFRRGTVYRAALDVLKATEGPLTVRESVLRLFTGMGEADPDLKTIRALKAGASGPPEPERTARRSRMSGKACRRGGGFF